MNYTLIKSKRSKYSRVRIKPSGEIIITVPYYFSDSKIDEVYLKFMPWIKKHMESAYDKSLLRLIQDNGFIYLLGNKTNIKVISDSLNFIEYNGDLIIHSNNKTNLEKIVDDFIKDYSKKVFKEIVDKYLKIMNLSINELKIKNMSACYGRCYKDKKLIILALSNIYKRYEFNEAVIVHELCHLKYSNHKKEFYDLVYRYYPNYKIEVKKKVN